MCADPMGMVWIKDLMAGKPAPTNSSPGLIYMLNGATSTASNEHRPGDRGAWTMTYSAP